jgi:hypothetical protein
MFLKIGQLANGVVSNTKNEKDDKSVKMSELGTTRNLIIKNEVIK